VAAFAAAPLSVVTITSTRAERGRERRRERSAILPPVNRTPIVKCYVFAVAELLKAVAQPDQRPVSAPRFRQRADLDTGERTGQDVTAEQSGSHAQEPGHEVDAGKGSS
jgi:hypothetical protein